MRRATRITSFLVGTAAALALLAAWRMPAGHANAATGLTVSVGGSRTVQLSRTGTVFDVARLYPGRALKATIVLRNTRRVSLHLRPRARLVGDDALTSAMQARVVAGGAQLFAGPLSHLARAKARRMWLQPRESTSVRFTLVLPASGAKRAAGRAANLALAFEVDP